MWRWWDQIQAIPLNLFYFKVKNENKEEMEVHKGLGIIDKIGPPAKKLKLVQEEIVLKYF